MTRLTTNDIEMINSTAKERDRLRLINAELLEALKEARLWVSGRSTMTKELQVRLDATISKAEGREP